MPPRTSSRSGTTRRGAPSPALSANSRRSQSPIGRTMRSTRSQSVELGGSDSGRAPTTRPKRGAREPSVESVDSNASAASSRRTRSRTATRAVGAVPRDLSVVVEGREADDQDAVSDAEDEDEAYEGGQETGAQRSQSPGALSQMSGTTVFTTMTSHSMEQVSSIDPIVAELLPKLLESTLGIMQLLAPTNILDHPQVSDNIVKELKAIGSRLGKRLKIEEPVFENMWKNFVHNDTYINLSSILRALLGTAEATDGPFRPDCVIHAANMAHLVRTFMVLEREHQDTSSHVNYLDLNFPKPFATGFDGHAEFGKSALLEEFFKTGLDIRTQSTILCLLDLQHREHYDPDSILANNFYYAPSTADSRLSKLNDMIQNGTPKTVLHGLAPEGKKYAAKIRERVLKIHSCFRDSERARREKDLVDFEELQKLYPWHIFQWKLAGLARLRVGETSEVVKSQGGIHHIKKSLIEALQARDSQIELQYSSPPSVIGAKVAETDREASPLSFYPEQDGKSVIRRFQKMKRAISSSNSTQALQSRPTPVARASSLVRNDQASVPGADEVLPEVGSDNELFVGTQPQKSSKELARLWDGHEKEKNKENIPLQKKKFSLYDRQPNAERVQWDSQATESVVSASKRIRDQRVESPESFDGGFETDERSPDPTRRVPTVPDRRRVPSDDSPRPSKRARTQQSDNSEDRRTVSKSQQQADRSPPGPSIEPPSHGEEDDENSTLGPTQAQIQASAAARSNRARVQAFKIPQKRIQWSEYDTQYLIDNVAIYGCSWSIISGLSEWEHERNQVALKDKARNIKVSYLKAGIELPFGFEHVALGKKEVEAVQRVVPGYMA